MIPFFPFSLARDLLPNGFCLFLEPDRTHQDGTDGICRVSSGRPSPLSRFQNVGSTKKYMKNKKEKNGSRVQKGLKGSSDKTGSAR